MTQGKPQSCKSPTFINFQVNKVWIFMIGWIRISNLALLQLVRLWFLVYNVFFFFYLILRLFSGISKNDFTSAFERTACKNLRYL